jgi:hypothetical protein
VARSGTERRYGRFARRALALALLTAGWTAVLAFAGAIAYAADTNGDSTGSAPVRRLVGVLDHTLRDLARTAESVPRTLHHVIGTVASPTTAPALSPHVRHRAGDTPRALGRPGHTRHRRAAVRMGTALRHPPVVAPVRAKTSQAVDHVPTTRLQHPRAPAPYSPTAPESLTAGPAVPSSGIAGPVLALTHHPHLNAPRLTRDEAPTCVPAPAPAVTGIPGCSPD